MSNKYLSASILLNVCFVLAFSFSLYMEDTKNSGRYFHSMERSVDISQTDGVSDEPETEATAKLSAVDYKHWFYQKTKFHAQSAIEHDVYNYWSARSSTGAAHVRSLLDVNESVRQALHREFGPDASDEPIFADVFKPLDFQFPFLSSAEQITVQQRQLSSMPGGFGAYAASSNLSYSVEPRLPRSSLQQSTASSKSAFAKLSTDSVKELNYRQSVLADQIRRSGVEFDESSYRDTYDVLAHLMQGRGQLKSEVISEALSSLQQIHSEDDAIKLIKSIHQTFARASAVGARHGLALSAIVSTVELLDEYDKKIRVAMRSERKSVRNTQLQSLLDERNERMDRLVGALARDELLQARDHRSTLVKS